MGLVGMDAGAVSTTATALERQLVVIDDVLRAVQRSCGVLTASWLGPSCGHLAAAVGQVHLPALQRARGDIELMARQLRAQADQQTHQSAGIVGAATADGTLGRVLSDAAKVGDVVGHALYVGDKSAELAAVLLLSHVHGYVRGDGTVVRSYVRFQRGLAPVVGRFFSARSLEAFPGKLDKTGKVIGRAGLVVGAATAGLGEWRLDQNTHLTDHQIAERVAVKGGLSTTGAVVGGAVGGGVGTGLGVAAGGALGAVIGSVVPGAGTLAGALVGAELGADVGSFAGGIVGANIGSRLGEKVADEAFDHLPSIFGRR